MSTTFWATHQVGGPYPTLKESEQALAERALLYPSLEELMPTHFPGRTILDYGCGPGHDTILFKLGGAAHVVFADISLKALAITSERLQLHGLRSGTLGMVVGDREIELASVDHIHSAGVLHHAEDPAAILARFRKLLRPGGEARIMVYNGDRSKHTQSEVPITHWWTRNEFESMAQTAGFQCEYVGSYPCSATWRPDCYAACYSLT